MEKCEEDMVYFMTSFSILDVSLRNALEKKGRSHYLLRPFFNLSQEQLFGKLAASFYHTFSFKYQILNDIQTRIPNILASTWGFDNNFN